MLDKITKAPIDLAVCSVMAMREFLVTNESQEWGIPFCGLL